MPYPPHSPDSLNSPALTASPNKPDASDPPDLLDFPPAARSSQRPCATPRRHSRFSRHTPRRLRTLGFALLQALFFLALAATLLAGDAAQHARPPIAQALIYSSPPNTAPQAAPASAVPTLPAPQELPALSGLRRVAQGLIPMPPGTAAAHASSLLVLPQSQPKAALVFWFSGERESGPQVQIAVSALDRATHTWSAPHFVVNRHTVGEQLGFGVRRIGNPVAWLDAQQRIHLFVVATGWGGWAASRVLHLEQSSASQDPAELRFAPVRVLPLSWLWNTSYLVRNAPLPLADGGMLLPVHFELGVKIPAALRFGPHGEFLGMVRMSAKDYWLQPALLALSPSHWIALMRDERHHGKIGAVHTQDSGQHWSDLPDLPLDNPDSAVATLTLGPQRMLLAHNPTTEGRHRLDLSYSSDGIHWKSLSTLAQGGPTAEFSYPALAWADNSLWVSYTVDRQYLAWQQFTFPAGAQAAASTTPASTAQPAPLAASVATPAPALPAPALAPWALPLGWGIVLAALAAALARSAMALVRKRSAHPAFAAPRASRLTSVAAAALALAWALWPAAASPTHWLGLAFQSPSLLSQCLCAAALWRLLQRPTHTAAAPVWPATQHLRTGLTTGLIAAGVVLGWVLLLDSFAWLPWQVYAAGFGTPALAVVLAGLAVPLGAVWLLVLVQMLRKDRARVHRSSLVLASLRVLAGPLAALALFVTLRLPTGNLWDALLDPLLWLVLHSLLLRRLLR